MNALATKENGTRVAPAAPDLAAIAKALAEPFAPDAIEWKPQSVAGNRALAICYIDARAVMDRLDAVIGPENWSDTYAVLADGNVVCTLSLRLGGTWVSKADVGGESDQKDEGDRRKASFSDALKRAAVKWGVGRYLYRLGGEWVDYDPQKKQLKGTPRLPAWALPAAAPGPRQVEAPPPKEIPLPRSGEELEQRVKAFEKRLVQKGLCKAGELAKFVLDYGKDCNLGEDVTKWPPEKFADVVEVCKKFERGRMATAGAARKPA